MADLSDKAENEPDLSTTTTDHADHPFDESSDSNSVIEIYDTGRRSRSRQRRLRGLTQDVIVLATDTHMTSSTTDEPEVNTEPIQQPLASPLPNQSLCNQYSLRLPIIDSNLHICGMGTGSESFCSGNLLVERMENPAVTSPPILRALHCNDGLAMTTRTITINLSESPSPSVMRRPPLMQRFLSIFSNTATFCLCSNFSRDCAILLLMYIGFTVLIFLLTVVSYNFLRVNIMGQHSANTSDHFCPYHSRYHTH